ncbi:MAG: enoyl-CoA hydratase-related protein, partial [Candidatus Kariarchaeaceae archaeon]
MTVQFSRDSNDIVTLTLNRPEKRNALNLEMINDLKNNLNNLSNDESVRCVI